MAPKIIDTRVPNEWLVRFDNDGNVCESLISYLEHLEIDGKVRHHGVTLPEKLDHTDLPNLSIVSDMAENAMVAVNKLTAERDTLRTDLDNMTNDHNAVVSERDAIIAQAQNNDKSLREYIAQLGQQMAEAVAVIENHNTERNRLTNELTALRNTVTEGVPAT